MTVWADRPHADNTVEGVDWLGCPANSSVYVQLCLVGPRRILLTRLRIDRPFTLDPSVGVFHYAQCLFEGLKAYRDEKGKVTLFRPDMNMQRMNTVPNGLHYRCDTFLAF